MKLIFEKGTEGRGSSPLPKCDVPLKSLTMHKRETPLKLPEVSEMDLSRHYSELAKNAFGVNCGFYPLGSCTMKYNPRINEEIAALPGFTNIHPLQPISTIQGCLEVLKLTEQYLCEITGMDRMTFQPAAGAHGEFTGLLLMKAYFESRGEHKRNKIIVPDSAHGTNPASCSMAGMAVINVPSNQDGCVDIEKFKEFVGEDTAGLMLTNPNTVGIFDRNILEITKIIHDAGGLTYYDGANLNAVMGMVRPGDMGFDIIHVNLHKTFSTPHGGGGPGAGPVGCKSFLSEFLPCSWIENAESSKRTGNSIGQVKAFYGNFLVVVKALAYMITLGAAGLKEASQNAVLNANYMKKKLSSFYDMAYDGLCMHEFVITAEKLKKKHNVSALDIAKALLDYGMHPPTMYFPMIVQEALMLEPTETESKETIDRVVDFFEEIYHRIIENPDVFQQVPQNTYVSRLDEVGAARTPVVKYNL